MRTGPCRAVWPRSTAPHCSWWQAALGGQQPRMGSYKPGFRRWTARGLTASPQIALTVLQCSPGEPGAGGGQAGRCAIGCGAPHVVQPGATIGLADCLKKEAQVPANACTCFNFLLSPLIPVCCCGTLQNGTRKNIRIFMNSYKTAPNELFKKVYIFSPPPPTPAAFLFGWFF